MNLKFFVRGSALVLAATLIANAQAEELAVGITADMQRFDGTINGEKITIMRNQDQKAEINPAFAKTSRKCPPFCIQPQHVAVGIETIGELEVIDYLKKMAAGDTSILLIDSRTPLMRTCPDRSKRYTCDFGTPARCRIRKLSIRWPTSPAPAFR